MLQLRRKALRYSAKRCRALVCKRRPRLYSCIRRPASSGRSRHRWRLPRRAPRSGIGDEHRLPAHEQQRDCRNVGAVQGGVESADQIAAQFLVWRRLGSALAQPAPRAPCAGARCRSCVRAPPRCPRAGIRIPRAAPAPDVRLGTGVPARAPARRLFRHVATGRRAARRAPDQAPPDRVLVAREAPIEGRAPAGAPAPG